MDNSAKRPAYPDAMSDKPISKGDLVMIISYGRNKSMAHHIGKIGKVLAPCRVYPDNWDVEGATISASGRPCSWHSRRLKRIDPPALSEDVPTKEELTV